MHTHKLFGTDGIRGTPGEYPLTEEMLYKIIIGITQFINRFSFTTRRRRVIIGRDTRLSGKHIEKHLANALNSQGLDVLLAGTITTPGLSFLTKEFKADIGIMISASHNKPTDNGIKFFNSKGQKLSTQDEEAIENIISSLDIQKIPKAERKGKIRTLKSAQSKYTEFLLSTVKGLNLKGIRVALDCASGSASLFTKEIFRRLNACIHSIHDIPKGERINIGGALQPAFIRELVLKTKSDIGIALDGDGDRGILVDEKGKILDGDYILAIMADYLKNKKQLPKNTIVTTVMANYGLINYLERIGIKAISTQVGDKYVLTELLKNYLSLGGEQSGHIIFLDYLPTPDGLLTALQVLKVMRDSKTKLSQLAKSLKKYPQVLVNVKVKEKIPFEQIPALEERLKQLNQQLQGKGRILLRYSGTEPLARVMVEGSDYRLIENIANSLAKQIKKEIGE
ncbi:MAG: phosphoglucosamine mutase [Candidatus Omnitrophica bacterium]|nr:phosphoglucosamine mutase [Candidatus Omnitrophota bacterium]